MELQEAVKKMIREELSEIIQEMFAQKSILTVSDDRDGIIIDPDKYYVVRTYSAGVFFGRIIFRTEKNLVMDDCQKIHYWEGSAAVEQLAVEGVSKPQNCRFTVPVKGSVIREWIQILPCTDKAIKNLKGVPIWKK